MIVKSLFSRVSSAAIAIAIVAGTAPALAAAAPAAKDAVSAWGTPLTDVTPDPAIKYGVLPNGMKYAIMRNAVPKGNAAVRLRFEFGSIAESDKEQGLAHFIEHMAFNGSTHVPEGDMVKILERQGLKFGPDTNAQTGFDSTTYMLDLPSTDTEHLDTAMMLMREVASEITFDKGALDRERGVIEGERRFRETAQLHLAVDDLKFNGPNTPYGNRLPIGTTEVINSVTPETIKDLYHRYYRPENATLIFVGDADPAVIEAKIKDKFTSWKGVGEPGAKLPRGSIDLKRAAAFDTFVDPSIPSIVELTSYRAWEDPADTRAERRNQAVRQLAAAMFNRRIEKISNKPDSVILGGGMSLSDTKDAALSSSIGVIAKDGHWKDAIGIADQELRRALQYGFLQSELDLQKTNLTSQLARAAEQADSRKSASIAAEIVAELDGHDFITTPAWDAKFMAETAPSITLAEVDQEFKKLWSGSPQLVHVSAKEPVTDQQVAEALGASTKLAVAKPADDKVAAFAYDNLGPTGTIAEDTHISDLGVRTIRFANNVRLNIKKTDFEPGKVTFLVRMSGGSLVMPKDEPGLGALIANMSALAGTKKHDFEDLRTLTSGKQITPGFSVGDDAFETAGTTTAADLPLQMKVTAAYMTDPGYRAEAGSQWASVVPLFDKQISAQPAQLLSVRLPYLLTGHDARFGLPPEGDLIKRNLNEFKSVYAQASATAPIEITIVGDVDEKAAVEAVAKSFGALPKRDLKAPDYAAARKVAWAPGSGPLTLTHTGEADQAVVGAVWRTDDDKDFRTEVGLAMVSNVLDLMLTDSVREKLGASYGASVDSTMSSEYTNFGYLVADAVVSPTKADIVDKAIADAVESLRTKQIDKDMLTRALNPELEKARRNLRENSYWLMALQVAQSEPDRLDRVRKRIEILQSVTPADIQKLAQTYLAPDRMTRLRVTSQKLASK
ncbi:MAG TPA: insulinase family protein [Sphingomicrobium sp.]